MKNILQTYLLILMTVTTLHIESVKSNILNEDCRQFIESIKTDFNYGWVNAPTQYQSNLTIPNQNILNSTESDEQKIFYYYRKVEKLKNPVLFFNGGPGFSSHSSLTALENALKKFELQNKIDFIFIDQRGTCCSSPGFPLGISEAILEKLKWSASLGIVHDAEIVREKILGPKSKWKIFGQSYGAYIVYRYIEKFPGSILKAYAHGNAIGVNDFDGSYYRILAQHTVTEKYLKIYSQDRDRLKILKKYFSNPKICYINSLNQDLCGYENLMPFVYMMGFSNNWKFLHSYLQKIIPDQNFIDLEMRNFITENVFQSYNYRTASRPDMNAETMTFFYNFAGIYDWDTTPFDAIKCKNIFQQINDKNKISEENLLLNECLAPYQHHYQDLMIPFLKSQTDLNTNQFVDIKQVHLNLSKFKIPTFSYSGELDSFISKNFFTLQNKTFGSKIVYRNFEFSGHEGYFTERQIFSDLMN